jgi:hypothetical protein
MWKTSGNGYLFLRLTPRSVADSLFAVGSTKFAHFASSRSSDEVDGHGMLLPKIMAR